MSTVTDPESMDQLINDCAQMPQQPESNPAVLLPRAAPRWEVDDEAQAHADDIDDYV